MDGPPRIPGESARAYAVFCEFWRLGATRTIPKLREALGIDRKGYESTLRNWSARHRWQDRILAAEARELETEVKLRRQKREALVEELFSEARQAVSNLRQMNRGILPLPDCECGAGQLSQCECDAEDPEECVCGLREQPPCVCGFREPLFNRHGDHVGYKATISPGTRKELILGILDRIGITPPKRTELSGPDGAEFEVAVQAAEGLPDRVLDLLRRELRKGQGHGTGD